MLLVLLAVPFAATSAQEPAAPRPPNILLLLADDMQWDALGFLGEDRIRTPNLDRLAARGVTFTHAYNQGSVHGAVCAPSRAMLITGRHLYRRGGDGAEGHPLWGEVFGAHGYQTFVTGKWHNGKAALERGFEVRDETGPGMLHSTKVGEAGYHRPVDGEPDPWSATDTTLAGHWLKRDGRTVHSSAHWIDRALDFLQGDRRDPTRPFFMHVAFHAPHDPRQAPADVLATYPADEQTLPPNYVPTPELDPGTLGIRDEILAPFPRTPHAMRVHLAEYATIITHLDAEIGRLLDALEARGETDDTVIVFTSDHGLAVSQHGLLGKQNLFEHSLRTPLVMAGPGLPVGARRDAPVYLHSLFPTACQIAGIPIPETVDTPGLLPLARGEVDGLHDTLYGSYAKIMRSVRDARFKLIVYPELRRAQLFDLVDDPWEMHDLSGDPAQRATLERLHAELLVWMDRVDDPLDREQVAEPWAWPGG